MRRFILVIVLIAGMFWAQPAQAQSEVIIENMDIGIWPEYDRPDVLIIYRITLSPDVALPVQMNVRIPAEAGTPYNLAMKDMDGMLYNLAYTTQEENDWLRVIFTAPSAEIQLEYYDPRLTKSDASRGFEYVWPGDFAVNNMVLSIQQPVNATDMQILPDFGAGTLMEDGLTYYTNTIGRVPAGTPVTIRFSYNKADDQLSFGSQAVQPVQAASGGAAGRTSAEDILPWVFGGLGILLVAGGLFWFLVTRNQTAAVAQGGKRHRRSSRAVPPSSSVENTAAVYCSQCGRKAAPGDLFCRSCGSRLRI